MCVSIADHGIGIKEDALPHIFDEYYRAAGATAHNKYSTGLGLSIVKEIVEKLNLGLSVVSEEGKGTSFNVFMPVGSGDSSRVGTTRTVAREV